jgi:hypothetical protein
MGYTRLGKNLTQAIYNGTLDALEIQNAKQFGKGILEGLELSDGGGFIVDIAAGTLLGQKAATLAGTTVTMPASVTRYVWMDESGATQLTATNTDPGGSYVNLGRVTSDGSGVTLVEEVGRIELSETSLLFQYTTAGAHTWTKPTDPRFTMAMIVAVGGGGGGASGRKGAAGTHRAGGGGGSGGAKSWRMIPLSLLGATEPVTVGAGGSGGAAQATINTVGNAGSDGGASIFGTTPNAWIRCGGGKGAPATGATNGNASGGAAAPGTNYSAAGGSNATSVGTAPVASPGGAGSGGAGGSITTGNVGAAGTQGGGNATVVDGSTSLLESSWVGGAGGAVDTAGTAGATMASVGIEPGPGGGGGGASLAANGGAGGAGGKYGGGGGGGGAAENTFNSGAGGAGADGAVFVLVF